LPPKALASFSFSDSTGKVFSTAPAASMATLVFFGYTNCPDVCPTTLADWVRVKRALGVGAKQVRFLFVSVDPARDTPAITARFAAQFDTSFVGVSGDSATTTNMQRAFGVASSKQPASSAEGYLMGHSSQAFLVDDKGRMVVTYAYGAGWDAMAADIKNVLH
jgi:protein SCO1/2